MEVCTKFITPALKRAGWDVLTQIREEVSFTRGRIIVRGNLVARGKSKRVDYILYYKPNIPLAIIEAKDNQQAVGAGMQQGLEYAATLDIPFVFSSNGDAFLFRDRTGLSDPLEAELSLDEFPKPQDLWAKCRAWKGLAPEVPGPGRHGPRRSSNPQAPPIRFYGHPRALLKTFGGRSGFEKAVHELESALYQEVV